ncbi:hypothetical protein D9757_005950 [Collybiopsis confluens]|uniref:DUF6533 domain-containing protein n=1 Tax=Collybiopsis confluens TaxID=2823264 RepID=A0A8H5HUD8_9AGAR|nr:hypothetical protein D9757_005950 [Collybiopsis confluens]
MVVLWIADFIATLPTEIRTMWFKKPTGTSVLFILNRYFFLLFLSIALVESTPGNSTDQGCQILYNSSEVLAILSVVMTSGRNSPLITALMTLNLASSLGFEGLCNLQQEPYYPCAYSTSDSPFQKFSRCGTQYKDTLLFNNILQLATLCIAFAFDAFISGLTILRTIRHAISMRRLGQASVTETTFFTGSNISTTWIFIVPFFNITLPNILISRLVLNLRTFSSFEETRSQTITTISGFTFATNRILGNIGAPMQYGDVEQEEEDVEE